MKLWEKFKFAIFDVDGTIFNNMEVSADVFYTILKSFNLPQEQVRKIYLETNGINVNDQLKLVLNKYKKKCNGKTLKMLHNTFFRIRDNLKEWKNTPLFFGIKPLVKKLNQRKIKIFVSSGSNTREIKSRLKNAGILKYFTLVIGGDELPKGSRHYRKIARYCGTSLKKFSVNAFYAADGPRDMEIAKSLGIFAVGITNTVSAEELNSAGADLVVSNINALISTNF